MARKRRKLVTCADSNCNGRYEITYENNAPIFTCNKCNAQDLTWKKFYTEYLQLYKEKSNWEVEKHKVTCVIGFFCHMYKETYGTEYVFVPSNRNPYSCKECRDAWKLLATFKGNAHAVRKYIYWLFRKLINKNTNIISFNYINTAGIIRKYNLYSKKKNKITRFTSLPAEFIDWCKKNIPNIFDSYELSTVNDLGALLSHINFCGTDKFNDETQAIQMAEKLNLVKNGRLNIRE